MSNLSWGGEIPSKSPVQGDCAGLICLKGKLITCSAEICSRGKTPSFARQRGANFVLGAWKSNQSKEIEWGDNE